jgi:bifunctional non-homologous end joining protein LigD
MAYRKLPPAPEGLPDSGDYPLIVVGETPAPPSEDNWLHEVKIDGWRLMLHIDGKGGVRLVSRRGNDWTWHFFAAIREVASCGHRAIIDGELAVPDESGRPRLRLLHNAMNDGTPERMVYYAFDLLYLDGKDLRSLPIEQRKAQLESLIQSVKQQRPTTRTSFVEHLIGGGPLVFDAAKRLDCEGIVSKRLGSPYRGGPKPASFWVKSLCNPDLGESPPHPALH